MSFVKVNPNPYGRVTGDCVIRAITIAQDRSWDDIYLALSVYGFEIGDWGNSNDVWGSYLKQQGYKRNVIPNTCPDCYTVRDFAEDHKSGTFILCTGTHVVTVINGDYYDAWDSGNEVPIYYWEKEKKV